tara:strand:+ start:680 stop:898 length:219 start_codon:yes stop_codon:yes gene_type:complete
MNLLKWFSGTSTEEEEWVEEIVVKNLKSKSHLKNNMPITVGDIRKGVAVDEMGYENEVVLFLRKNKKDRWVN